MFYPPHAEKTVILKNKLNWYINILEKNPFSVAFLTILFAYIPYIILSFPGIFMGDTSNQIAQCYNLKENTSNYLNLISENVRLNNHHPVVHSLLIHLFIMIGKTVFNSYNIGVFLYCSFQLVIVVSVIALLIKIYVKLNMNLHIVLFTMLYFIISPRIQNYMFLITKDIIFSSLLLLFVLMFYKAPESLKEKVIIAISLLGIILFRNDGKYLIILSAFITGILSKKLRRPMFSIIIGTICISTILSKIILPSFQITPSSRREVLSIPFQQTARYVRDAKSDVTPEEKRIISKILDYDSLAEKYDPNIADPVKATFNEYASTSDIKQYFQCWLQMFFKHPGIYLQAILNNKYRFFYPTSIPNTYSYSWSMRQMERTNKLTLDRVNTNFSYPSQLNTFRNIYEQFREVIFNVPVLSILLSTSTYTWLLILWTCYCLKQKNITSIIYLIPLYTQLFISMAGPCNGQYFRYLYPIAFCLPPSITLGFESLKTNFIKKEIQ